MCLLTTNKNQAIKIKTQRKSLCNKVSWIPGIVHISERHEYKQGVDGRSDKFTFCPGQFQQRAEQEKRPTSKSMPSVVISILSESWIILSLTIQSMLPQSERRIIQGIDVCPAVCLDNGRYQKCFVCGDNTDEVPFISRPALSNAISQTIYPRSQRLHHIYFPGWSNNRDKVSIKDRQNQLLHDPNPIRKKINLN